jgi:hypothetical protein
VDLFGAELVRIFLPEIGERHHIFLEERTPHNMNAARCDVALKPVDIRPGKLGETPKAGRRRAPPARGVGVGRLRRANRRRGGAGAGGSSFRIDPGACDDSTATTA